MINTQVVVGIVFIVIVAVVGYFFGKLDGYRNAVRDINDMIDSVSDFFDTFEAWSARNEESEEH